MLNDKVLHLFILKTEARNMQYGIGTYLRELTHSLLKMPAINIYIVSIKNHGSKEFSVESIANRLNEIIIPYPFFLTKHINSFDKKYALAVVRLLSDYIPKTGSVIFQINNYNDLPIAIKLKEHFNYPLISIVHAANWQMLFAGNQKNFYELDIDKPSNSYEIAVSQEREMYRKSDHIVSVTEYMNEFLKNEYLIDSNKITTIHNGLDNSKYTTITKNEKINLRVKMGFRKNDIIILFSGRLDPSKGIFFLLDAFEEACKQNSELRLVVLGGGSIENLQKKIKSYFGKVTFTGFLQGETVLSFYQIADMGVLPSVFDHCPYSLLEMMANRLPLILSRIQGLNEILTDEGCLFVNPVVNSNGDVAFNIQELSEAIQTLARDKELRTKLSTNSYYRFLKEFTSNRMAEMMFNLFNALTINDIKSIKYD